MTGKGIFIYLVFSDEIKEYIITNFFANVFIVFQ